MAPSGERLGGRVDRAAYVAVCPVGIDLGQGRLMECITWASSIDACDDVMA